MISASYKDLILLINVYHFSFLNNLQIHDLFFVVIFLSTLNLIFFPFICFDKIVINILK